MILVLQITTPLFPRSFFPPPIPHSGNHPRQLVHHEAHLAVERRHNNGTFTGGTQHTFTLALKERSVRTSRYEAEDGSVTPK